MGATDTTMTARTDENGLQPLAEVAPFHEGWAAGYAIGYAAGRADHEAESWPAACEIVNNAARSIDVMEARRRPYVVRDWATPRPGVQP